MRVIIAAAGTGGHINPGIAIANKIKEKEKNSEILFVGTLRGIENDLVPRAGYKLKTIEAYGFSKKLNINSIKNNIKTMKSTKSATKIIDEFKPDVVIGTGGYICGPVIMAAKKRNIPTFLHESNAAPGLAVKLLSKKVDEIFVGFKEAKESLPKAKKVVVTGTPTKIKKQNLTIDQIKEEKAKLGLNKDLPVLLVFGGSQGAQKINNTIIELIEHKKPVDYQIMWATGQKNYDNIKEELKQKGLIVDNIKNVNIVPYIYNMEDTINCADLLVCRSGAITIVEIAKIGKPAIFIPLPNVSHNHQEKNARVLEKNNAAYVILNDELTADKLSDTISGVITNKNKLHEMGLNAKKIDVEDVEEKIYREIKNTLNFIAK